MVLDTHHHFWKYNPLEFDWITDEMASIRRDFLPADLKETLASTDVEGVISVQARQTLEETRWLLELAENEDFIRGVTGWVPLMSKGLKNVLDELSENKKLKGVRHVVQGEPDPAFILRDDFNRGIDALKEYQLLYEILIYENQLPATIQFVDKHSNQLFVLDHIAKPGIKFNRIDDWAKNLHELAKRENIYCKISGMVTEADLKNWTPEQLEPYFNVVFKAFGPSRLMFGSDWPVCLSTTTYNAWLALVKSGLKRFSEQEQKAVLYDNAIKVYSL
jgi:L-fuconolactonase